MAISKYPGMTDYELLEWISMKDDPDCRVEAERAAHILFDSYWEIMYKIALNVCRSGRDPEADAQDLVLETFARVFEKAGTFDARKATDSSKVRNTILKWMTTIMKRIFYDSLAKNINGIESGELASSNSNSSLYEKTNQYIEEIEDGFFNNLPITSVTIDTVNETDDQVSPNLQALLDFIDHLSERDAGIFRECYQYYVPGKKLPSEVLESVCEKYGTTKDNIRKILSRIRSAAYDELKSTIKIRS